jgi:RecA-family ATPase
MGCDFSDLGAMRWISGAASDNAFVGFDPRGNMQVFPRFYEIQRAAKAHGAELIILDGAADLFAGNENDRGHVKRFVNLLTSLARDQGAAVLLLSHPSRSGLATGSLDSGSTGWHNSVRSRWTLAPEPSEGGAPNKGLILTRAKSNYAPGDPKIRLQWARGILTPADRVDGPSGTRPDAEAVFMDLLTRCARSGIRVSESVHGTNFAPKIFAKRPDCEGYTRGDFDRAMQGLFASETIEVRDWRDANGHPRRSIFVSKPEEEGQE